MKAMDARDTKPILPQHCMTSTSSMASTTSHLQAPQHGPMEPARCAPLSTTPSNLRLKLAGDALVGTTFTFFVAPFLFAVDKAIAQRASGTNTLLRSGAQTLRGLVTHPVTFVKSPAFLYVWAVYASTYTVANTLKTLVEHQEQSRKTQSNSSSSNNNNNHADVASYGRLAIFLGTSITNSGGSAIKDRFIARTFAARDSFATTAKVPVASYGLWVSRDLVSIGSSFVLPDLIARKFATDPEDVTRLRDISQIGVPIVTQFVAGPLHLLGLDMFNRPMQDLSLQRRIVERSSFLVQGYGAAVGARVARIIPGYGLGGVLNTHLRDSWRSYLLEREADKGAFMAEGRRMQSSLVLVERDANTPSYGGAPHVPMEFGIHDFFQTTTVQRLNLEER
jgi:hypothetical protein